MTILLKRAYEQPAPEDGTRVLVERLWPRGLSKERAAVDLWLKEVSPSPELRRWFGHDPAEVGRVPAPLPRRTARPTGRSWSELRRLARSGPVTFVYAARDTEHNSAALLREVVEERRQADAA